LPVTHTTDWWVFREIFERGEPLKPTFCTKYKDDLLYLFYGRPCYRPHADVEPTSLSSFFLICILFEPSGMDLPYRVMPFDSGAMIRGHYAPHLHPRMLPADFELEPTVSRVTSAVDRFYGSNSAYFQGTPRNDVAAGPRDLEVEAFLSIIKSVAQSSPDDRRSTIEIQLKQQVDLRKSKVLAVILPEQLLADTALEDFIEVDLQAEAIDYFCPHARPLEDARAIMVEAKRFYEKKGWL
jgi:hypothetical protein